MKFLFNFISATMLIAIVFVTSCIYFDFPISTHDDEQQNTPVETSTESLEQDNTQEQQAPATIPSHEKSPTEVQESIQRKSEIQALQENDKQQDWKKEYDKINEGTDENPYVMIDGKPVDPKHVIGKEHLYDN